MSNKVKTLHEISSDQQARAGGKGGTLARLIQAGYPVPNGFVVMPSAFEDDQLLRAAICSACLDVCYPGSGIG